MLTSASLWESGPEFRTCLAQTGAKLGPDSHIAPLTKSLVRKAHDRLRSVSAAGREGGKGGCVSKPRKILWFLRILLETVLGTVGTGLETVLGTVAKYIETVTFLFKG